jgi:hypothetical protein
VPAEARFGFGSRTAATVDVRVVPPPGSPTGVTDVRGVPVNRMVVLGAPSGPC